MKRWQVLLLVTVVALIGIQLFEPDYTKLQTADNADAFRIALGDDRGRAIGAALCDLVFAAGYGLLGVMAFRALATGRGALIGVSLIAGAAIADELENLCVLTNLALGDDRTNGWINVMRAFGYAKNGLLILSLLCLAVFGVARIARARR